MFTEAQIEALIIKLMTAKPGVTPSYAKIGGYTAADPVFDRLIEEGRIVRRTKLSPKGKRMTVHVLAEFADQFDPC